MIISSQRITRALEDWGISSLVKFFDKQEYANAFIEGKLHLRAIEDYRKHDLGDGRSDPYEGLATPFMGANTERAIYCMTWLPDSNLSRFLTSNDGKRLCSEFARGESAILINDPAEFLIRFQRTEKDGIDFGIMLYDGDVFGDSVYAFMHPGKAAFHKNSRFAYQHEFRIVTGYNCKRIVSEEEIDGMAVEVLHGHEAYRKNNLSSLSDIATVYDLQSK